jgi:serine/threonine protein kinase
MSFADGADFGPYRIIGRLGRGGMATVYRAYEPGLDRYVALKVLPEDSLDKETAVRRFEQEARAVARLVHPNIVPVLAFGIEAATRTPWMALQLIEGGSLASLLAQGALGQRRAVGFLRGIAGALDYAHSQGVLHRDVKPQNVLVAAADHVYLADFGLARILERSTALSASGTVLGTPQYMAPEQALGQELDHSCDIYALGIVAYELLAGAPPFQADTPLAVLMKHVREPIPIPGPDRVAAPLLRPVLKALAKEPRQRWATALAFVEALEAGLAEALVEQPTLPFARLPPQPIQPTDADGGTPEPATRPRLPRTVPAPVPARPELADAPARTLVFETPTRVAPALPLRAAPIVFGAAALVLAAGAAILILLAREPAQALVPATVVVPTPLPPPPSVVPPTTLPTRVAGPSPEVTPSPDASPVRSRPLPTEAKPEATRVVSREPVVAAVSPRARTPLTGSATPEAATQPRIATGLLRVKVNPWAEVAVDERTIGMTPFRPVALQPGPHVVSLSNPSYYPIRRRIVIRPGETTDVEIDLMREAFPK